MTSRPASKDVLQQAAVVLVGTAAFPRLHYWLRWPTRLGPLGFLAYTAFEALMLFAIRTWVIPYAKRMAEKREGVEQELRAELGREPTEDEILAHLGISCGR